MALHEEDWRQSRRRHPANQCRSHQRTRITHHQPLTRSRQPPTPQQTDEMAKCRSKNSHIMYGDGRVQAIDHHGGSQGGEAPQQ
jgi:hypothetical protein